MDRYDYDLVLPEGDADPDQMKDMLIDVQIAYWFQMDDAIRNAANGVWSIQCETVVRWLLDLSRAVGPSHPGSIPWSLVVGGVYTAITDVNVAQFVTAMSSVMKDHPGTPVQYATLAAVVRLRTEIEAEMEDEKEVHDGYAAKQQQDAEAAD